MSDVARQVDTGVDGGTWSTVGDLRTFARHWQGNRSLPVVAVHGLVVSGAYFRPLAEALRSDLSLVAPDQPGFGRSDPPEVVLTVPELARHLIDWFGSAQVGRADVVANSFGCQVVAEVAMRRPDLVKRLVLTSPTLDPVARTVPSLLSRWMQESRTQSWALRRLLVTDYARAGAVRAVQTVRQMMADRIEDKLPHIETSTLVVRGTADPICTEQFARRVTDLVPHADLAVIDGAPHAMVFDAPVELAEAIRTFLE